MNGKSHWETIYGRTAPDRLSWFQPAARLSLETIQQTTPELASPIIDVGAGASALVDNLLHAGYTSVTLLDLARTALDLSRTRLGPGETRVNWIEADVLTATLRPDFYLFWHDRAVFHFLTEERERAAYKVQLRRAVRIGGHVLIATFADDGPTTCSGLPVERYSADQLATELEPEFRVISTTRENHLTPSGKIQPFVYCLYQREAD